MTMTGFRKLLIGSSFLAIALPVLAQESDRRPSSDAGGGGGRGIATVSSAAPATSDRGIAVSGSYGSTSGVSARPDASPYSTTPTVGGGYGYSAPNLQGTSFYSLNCYYDWQNFLWHLRSRYMLDNMYFNRFLRNSEPLITPQLLRLAVREPLMLSGHMIQAVDALESMLTDLQAGKPVRKQDISAKAQEIRELAKRIRKDQSLSFISQRLDKDLTKGKGFDNLGLEAVKELRQMVTDLHTQLKGMYTQSATASVSVDSLTQPSFESLAKGIEKLTKIVENSARHL